jgi:formate hydrogenlyase subunit 3/multisubunit Na+/H+ antiporter MnhD subunit
MSAYNTVLAIVESVIWYFFIWYLLDTTRKKDRNLWVAAFILLALGYLGFVACPWVRETRAWEQLTGR